MSCAIQSYKRIDNRLAIANHELILNWKKQGILKFCLKELGRQTGPVVKPEFRAHLPLSGAHKRALEAIGASLHSVKYLTDSSL
ncbi:hypothetical protein PGTUg99_027010 [Puccinia graminis f. sp. tritici]|uniref:Uncharacterized protein n=1 Tax=Puccinia graminis f. sp. tritici TaxID=56615 RepID=A0A5B0RZF8_PUCGR|nr:hypothetical protein PGTUg99_027010 [Puccinia graminis f. sp. tritici]